MLLVKIWQCLHLFILRNIGQENKFHPILRGKNTFLEYKNNKSKKSKDWNFSKENVHGFGQNLAMLTSLNSKQNRPRKCVLWYFRKEKRLSRIWKQEVLKVKNSRKKNAFLRYKNRKAKASKNWDFSMVLVKLGNDDIF